MSDHLSIYGLPIEIHLVILDLLTGDRATLRACCLTCKLWLRQAQRNLFHAVELGEHSSASFRETVDRRPDLVECIRECTLNVVEGTINPPTTLRPTSVQLLRLIGMDTSNPWVRAILSTSRLSVRRLSLRECYAHDIADLVDFLRQMPNLKNIDMEHCRLESVELPPILCIDAPDLQSLSLVGGEPYDTRASSVARTFLACPGVYKKLSILTIRLPCRCLDVFNRFLEGVGPGLRELVLGVGPDAVYWRESDFPLTLEHCPNLLLLGLEFRLRRPSDVFETDHLFWVPALLANLRPPGGSGVGRALPLRRVKLLAKAVGAHAADLTALALPRLATVLGTERFAGVRRVLIHVVGGFPRAEEAATVVPYLQQGLAALDAKGVLRCVYEPARAKGWCAWRSKR